MQPCFKFENPLRNFYWHIDNSGNYFFVDIISNKPRTTLGKRKVREEIFEPSTYQKNPNFSRTSSNKDLSPTEEMGFFDIILSGDIEQNPGPQNPAFNHMVIEHLKYGQFGHRMVLYYPRGDLSSFPCSNRKITIISIRRALQWECPLFKTLTDDEQFCVASKVYQNSGITANELNQLLIFYSLQSPFISERYFNSGDDWVSAMALIPKLNYDISFIIFSLLKRDGDIEMNPGPDMLDFQLFSFWSFCVQETLTLF